MFCKNCGTEISGGVCPYCGTQNQGSTSNEQYSTYPQSSCGQNQYNTNQYAKPPSEKYNPFALTGFIVSLASLLIGLWGIVGITGAVFSCIGLVKCNETNEKGRGMAIAGLVVGICSTVLTLIACIACVSILETGYYW